MLGLPEITTAQATGAFAQITGSATPTVLLASGMVAMARMLGFMIVAPFFGSMNVPMTARVGFAAVIAFTITPFIASSTAPGIAAAGGGTGFTLLLVNQVLIGLMLGFVAAFVFYAIESAGRIIDTQRGSNMMDIIAPQSGERTSPAGQWLMMLALVILVVSGQHMLLLGALIDSFSVFPATTSLDWIGSPTEGNHAVIYKFAELSGHSLEITVKIAAPAMISLMLADVLLGIINRGAPQVNVFALSQVIKGPIGIAAVFVALAPIVVYLREVAFVDIVRGEYSITHLARMMGAG